MGIFSSKLFIILALLFLTSSADAGDTLRCGSALISIGCTAGEVLYKCGEPASGSQRESVTINGHRSYRTIITNSIEDWIYNFGPNRFQYLITMENGRVIRLQSLDKGY